MKLGRGLFAAIVVAGTMAVATISGASPAMAGHDNGDGSEACNRYEICINRYATTTSRYRKHFYYGHTHVGVNFWDATNNVTSSISVQNGANGVINKDGSHYIAVIDDRGFYPDDVYCVNNDGVIHDIPASVDYENDRHEIKGTGGC